MSARFEQHTEDDVLELYARGRLDEANAEILEEHLLICEPCRGRLEETERYLQAMRGAAARLRTEEPALSWAARVRALFAAPLPAFAMAGAVAALAIGVSFVTARRPVASGEAVAVELTAERGEAKSVPAGHELVLKLDTTGLVITAPAKIALVDAAGKTIENGQASVARGRLEFRTHESLAPGGYLVKLYGASAAAAVREYALEVR